MEGFVLGCDEGMDEIEGTEDTEGCVEGSWDANSVEPEEDDTIAVVSALDTFDISCCWKTVKFWPAQVVAHSVFPSATTVYPTETTPVMSCWLLLLRAKMGVGSQGF